jgi:hypothetical protein
MAKQQQQKTLLRHVNTSVNKLRTALVLEIPPTDMHGRESASAFLVQLKSSLQCFSLQSFDNFPSSTVLK